MRKSGHRAFGILALLLFAMGCGSAPARQLHPTGGDAFTLFPEPRREPPPITCGGAPKARFDCLVAELEERASGQDVSGALVLDLPTGDHMAFAQQGGGTKVTADTRFPLASMTKMFLGATAASLAESGELDLKRPVASYLPELEQRRGPGRASVHQLLTHTSGLGAVDPCEQAEDIGGAVRAFGKKKLWAPPGAVFNYSNLGYTYVAAVIEKVTGKPFEAVVHERVLQPVGIGGGSFDPAAVSIAGQPRDDGRASDRCRALRPAGGLALTIVELSHFIHAVSDPERSPLGKAVVERVTAPYVRTGRRERETYGYGVFRFFVGSEPIYAHGGNLRGYSSFVAWTPRFGAGGGAFANAPGNLPGAAVARGLSTFLRLPVDWNGPEVPVHPLERYEGTYVDRIAGLGRVRITRDGDLLDVDYLDGPPPLWPVTFRFFFDDSKKAARYVVTEVGVGERQGVSSP